MNSNEQLLNFIYQNSKMGTETLGQIIKLVDDVKFLKQVNSQLDEYRMINDKAASLLKEHNCDIKDISSFEKVSAYLMINMKTLTDKSPSHIAQMMITGSNMGIIDAIKKIKEFNKNNECNEDIVDLMRKLLKFEEENVKVLKEFL